MSYSLFSAHLYLIKDLDCMLKNNYNWLTLKGSRRRDTPHSMSGLEAADKRCGDRRLVSSFSLKKRRRAPYRLVSPGNIVGTVTISWWDLWSSLVSSWKRDTCQLWTTGQYLSWGTAVNYFSGIYRCERWIQRNVPGNRVFIKTTYDISLDSQISL